jgi:glycerol-3-phosphate dehydrogenase
MLETIRSEPSMADDVMDSADYLRVELFAAASTEMIVRLEDFMRRRSKIELVVWDERIEASEGLREVAEILFGADAELRLAEYRAFRGWDPPPEGHSD